MARIRLRPWQRAALDAYATSSRPDFLAVATPGAGKTTFALTAVAQALADRRVRSVVVVAPTQHLKSQWSEAAHRFGLHLDPDWSARNGTLPIDMHGIVTTYQQVATSSGALRALSSGSFVVLDEVHHAGDDRAWGTAVLDAFEPAALRLSLSGTPFRSDTSAIPFVEYHLDEALADFEYGYGEALVDRGVVRPVYFPRFGGEMEWVSTDGNEVAASFDDDLTRDLANQRLRASLSLDGDWLTTVLGEANERLMAIRQIQPNAAGLVIATDQEHAKGIVELLRRRFGQRASVATSDDPMASARIARFAATDEPWIVAVRMISEGVDIPRLRVGVFATNTTTELFFRQAVGRLVRWTRGVKSQKSYLFIPDDPRLRRWASSIAEQRRHSLAKRQDDDEFGGDPSEFDDRDRMAAAEDEQQSLFSVISAVASDGATEVGAHGDAFDDDEWGDDDHHGAAHPGLDIDLAVPPPPGLSVNALAGELAADGEVPEKSRTQIRNELRDANSTAVQELARYVKMSHQQINSELNRLAGIRRVTEATIGELEIRLEKANQWLRKI